MDTMSSQYERIPCGRAENLEGCIFGLWKVLYRTHNNNYNKVQWVCECQCEKHTIKPVNAKDLKAGTSTNCGCQRLITIATKSDQKIHQRDEKGNIVLKRCSRCHEWKALTDFWKNSTCKDGYHNECIQCYNTAKENRYNIYKKGAKNRKLKFQISKEEFYYLTSQPCYYCGTLENYKGLDRIDSTKHYTIDNLVPCCTICNRMKLNYTQQDFLNHIQKIAKYNKGKNNE